MNIWRSNAQDAGVFEPAQYESFKRQIYQKSIKRTLYWVVICIEESWLREADLWLRVYRARSNVIGVFDQARYDRLDKRIKKKRKYLKERAQKRKNIDMTS